MIRFLPAMVLPGEVADPVAVVERDQIVRAQRLDGQAFRQLFERHAPAVHRFLRDLFGESHAAEEATQETFVRAFHRLGKLREGDRFGPWVFGIARNVFREQRRRRWFEGPRTAGPAGDASKAELDAPLDPSTPESQLLGRERAAQLDRALQRLREDRRSALLLRFDHGLSCAEVAEVMGWSVAKVKVEVHRARAQLRAALAEAAGEGA